MHQNFNIRKNDFRKNYFHSLHNHAGYVIHKSNVMGRLLEDLYQEAIESNLGIHFDDSVIFLGHKIYRRDDNTIRICETGSKNKDIYNKISDKNANVLLENGWINGVKQLYLNKYIPMSFNPDHRISTFANSKLNKYYERFRKAK